MKQKCSRIVVLIVTCILFAMTLSNFNVIAQAKTSEKKQQVISVGKQKYTKQIGDKKFSLKAKTSGDGKLTYKTSNKKIVTVSKNGYVSIVGEGTAKVTISASETNTYKKASKTVKIIVKSKNNTGISFSGTDETYAIFVYEDGKEVPVGKEIDLSKLEKGGARIYFGNKIANVGCAYIASGIELSLEDDDLNFALDHSVSKNDKSSLLPLDNWIYRCIVEEGYYENLAIYVAGYDKDGNRVFENYFNWPINLKK